MVWLDASRPPTGALEEGLGGKYDSTVGVDRVPRRLVCDDGGCEKAFGCGVNTLSLEIEVLVPSAVESSSSSMSAWDRFEPSVSSCPVVISSFELLRTLSDSLSLSSYSSWLLPAALDGRPGSRMPRAMSSCKCLRRRWRRMFESWRIWSPVVKISLSPPADDRDEEEGCEEISTHESA
jgi:hypothetical protein